MQSSSRQQAAETTRLSRPVLYSLLVHVALISALIFGVNWRNDEPQSVAVELWDALPAQQAVAPQPRAEPRPTPEPKPEPPRKTEPRPEPARKARDEPVPKAEPIRDDAEIKRKAEAKRELAKKLAAEREQKQVEKEGQQKERDDLRKRKLDEERVLKQAREKEETALLQRTRLAAEQRALEAARAGQQRASNTALIEEYKRKIRSKILANVIKPPDLTGAPEAVFEVVMLPGGDVLNARLTKPSGSPAWDSAVERAIRQSQPLPLPPDPALFSQFRELDLRFKP